MAKIGISFEGGGSIAAAWGLGVLACLHDLGLNREVVTISSVSGGSFTNAFFATDATGYAAMDVPQFEAATHRLASMLAGRPRLREWLFGAGIAQGLLFGVALYFATGRQPFAPAEAWGVLAGLDALSMVLIAIFVAPRCLGAVTNWWGTWVYLVGMLLIVSGGFALAIAQPFPNFLDGSGVTGWIGSFAVYGAIALFLFLFLFQYRGAVTALAYASAFWPRQGSPTLSRMHATPQHVICATELHSGSHLYLSHNFVFNFDIGITTQSDSFSVQEAVAASTALPGIWPARFKNTAGITFQRGHREYLAATPVVPPQLVLVDGGVYDNLGEQWPMGYGERVKWLKRQPPYLPPPSPPDPATDAVVDGWAQATPDLVLVASARAGVLWEEIGFARFSRRLGTFFAWLNLPIRLPHTPISPIAGAGRELQILEEAVAAVRRRELIGRFDQGNPAGAIIHVETSPGAIDAPPPPALADLYDPVPPLAAHARAVAADALRELEQANGDETPWVAMVEACANSEVMLYPIGSDLAGLLMYQSYALTYINMRARFGAAPPAAPAHLRSLAECRALATL